MEASLPIDCPQPKTKHSEGPNKGLFRRVRGLPTGRRDSSSPVSPASPAPSQVRAVLPPAAFPSPSTGRPLSAQCGTARPTPGPGSRRSLDSPAPAPFPGTLAGCPGSISAPREGNIRGLSASHRGREPWREVLARGVTREQSGRQYSQTRPSLRKANHPLHGVNETAPLSTPGNLAGICSAVPEGPRSLPAPLR